jgi:hypothetical protein
MHQLSALHDAALVFAGGVMVAAGAAGAAAATAGSGRLLEEEPHAFCAQASASASAARVEARTDQRRFLVMSVIVDQIFD